MRLDRAGRIAGLAWGLCILGSTPVAASKTAEADPQPGFGVLLALVAILVALVLARRKRRSYLEGGSS